MKSLNGMEVNDNLRLAVGWCSQQDFTDMQELVPASSVSSDGEVLMSLCRKGRVWVVMRSTCRRRMSSRSPSGLSGLGEAI